MISFAQRLKELREEAGLSLNSVAEKVGVSSAAVCKWENGLCEPKVSYLILLSELFDCTVDFLIGKYDEFSNNENDKTHLTKLSEDEKQLLHAYRILDTSQKRLLKKTVEAWQ